jgi:hypothetical protein
LLYYGVKPACQAQINSAWRFLDRQPLVSYIWLLKKLIYPQITPIKLEDNNNLRKIICGNPRNPPQGLADKSADIKGR